MGSGAYYTPFAGLKREVDLSASFFVSNPVNVRYQLVDRFIHSRRNPLSANQTFAFFIIQRFVKRTILSIIHKIVD